MISTFAIDYGAWTPPETLDYPKLAASGIGLHIIGVTGNRWLTRHLMQAREAGVPHEVYVIPSSWTTDGGHAMDAALTAVHLVYPQGRVWIDVEPLPSEPNPDQRAVRLWVEAARKCAEGAGYTAGLYGNVRTWRICTGADVGFDRDCASLPKWDACYDNLPYSGYSGAWGGTDGPLVNQYAGSRTFCGANVDLDWIEGEARMMTDEQIIEALGNILGTLGEFGKRTDFLAAELYKAVDGRADKAKAELAYTYAAAGKPLP